MQFPNPVKMKVRYFLLIAVAFFGGASAITTPCLLRTTKHGAVCVCTASYCDYLDNPSPIEAGDFTIISSSKAGLRFSSSNGKFNATEKYTIQDYDKLQRSSSGVNREPKFDPTAILLDSRNTLLQLFNGASSGNLFAASASPIRSVKLSINRGKQHQRIVGFGGAFTGAVSYNLDLLDQKLQDQVYRSLYHQQGIGFNMLRIPIAGCDFDLEPWAYNEEPRDDPQLTNFTKLDARDERKIVQIQRLKEVGGLENIKIKAAAWSPPTWMKSNNEWTGFSHLKPEYYQAWADYHLRFLELMDAKNMPIWAISTGNEPLNGVIGFLFVRFMSLGWTPSNQAIWLSEHLGPTIRSSKYKDLIIFSNDDQRYSFPAWFRIMNATRSHSLDYLDGLAVHWYWDEFFSPTLIDQAMREWPNKLLFNTESSIGDKPGQFHGPELGSWERGEMYMRAYLQDFQHNFNGWLDWNIVLDERGGPNYVNNFVDAAIIVNATNRAEIYKQPIFYAIGHFSKLVPEDSVRVDAHISDVTIDAVAFQRPDNKVVAVLSNSGRAAVDVALTDSLRGDIVISVPARSMHTVIYN